MASTAVPALSGKPRSLSSALTVARIAHMPNILITACNPIQSASASVIGAVVMLFTIMSRLWPVLRLKPPLH